MKKAIVNIKELYTFKSGVDGPRKGEEMKNETPIENCYVGINDGIISEIGSMDDFRSVDWDDITNAKGKMVLPAFCDSHTHIVYAAPRQTEFVDRIKGLSYEEIASRGGGILNSAKKMRETSEHELFMMAWERLKEVRSQGTGAIEIKSGYGLDVETELKMLRVIKRLKEESPLLIKSTFLGAHALPPQYKDNREAYIDLIINEMIPVIEREGLADFIDVFCESGYFTPEETERIILAGKEIGLKAKIHVNQFTSIGGVEVSVKNEALSVDHLEILTDDDLDILKSGKSLPVALPGCSFFLSIPYTPARKIIDSNLPLVLASDYNPGSTPSGNMQFAISLASIKMNMLPIEGIAASTINGAYAMDVQDEVGSIEPGKRANLIITKEIPEIGFIAYDFGNNNIEEVLINGM